MGNQRDASGPEPTRREFTPIMNQVIQAGVPLTPAQAQTAMDDIRRRLLAQYDARSENDLNPGQLTTYRMGVARARTHLYTVTNTPLPPEMTGK